MIPALREVSAALMLALTLVVVGGLALVVVIAVTTALTVAVMAGGAWAAGAVVVAVGILAGAGMAIVARRRRRKPPVGVQITTEEQPLFWVEIYRVAEGLGIRSPEELFLLLDASVGVSERRTWMGLRPGVRRLNLGLPLLAGLTERELRAVIGHKLGRSWGPASVGRVVASGQVKIGRLARRVGEDSMAGRILKRYRDVYVALSGPSTTRQELAVDRQCADFAGNNATAAAMREASLRSHGWDAFVDGYAEPAAAVHLRPENLLAGFTCFLDEPGRRMQLAELAAPSGTPERSADGELTLGERLAAIESLPEDGIHDKSGPALGMMRNPDHVIRRVEESVFDEDGVAPSTWEDIVPEAARAAAGEDALQLAWLGHEGGLGPTLSVSSLLELISLGLVDEMVRPILPEGAAKDAERRAATRLVTGFLATAAIESGTASYRFSWAAPRQLVDDQGAVDDLPLLVEGALGDGNDVAALQLWVQAHRVDLELELGADLGRAVRGGPAGEPDAGPGQDVSDPGPSLVRSSGTSSI